MLLSSDKL